MIVERVAIGLLKEAPYNARVSIRDDPELHRRLERSISDFGYIEPIVWNRRTGHVIGGNQRLQVLRERGDAEVEAVVVDFDPEREKAASLALNRVVGQWDMPRLQALMASLDEQTRAITGFDGAEIEKLLKHLAQEGKDLDAVPEPVSCVMRPGDIVILGRHRLMCGDSLIKENVERLMHGEKAAMAFTDPPYNMGYGAKVRIPDHDARPVLNDSMSAGEWDGFCRKFAERLKDACGGDIYVWGAASPEGMRARLALVEAGCHWSGTIIWAKDSAVISPSNYLRQYEPCFYGWFEKSSFQRKMNDGADRSGLTDVWEMPRPKVSELHPTMKPVELCEKGIINSSREGDTVLDLFGGSGSTLIACERTDRRCFMMELDPHYCDVIVRRWEDFSGERAVRPDGTPL